MAGNGSEDKAPDDDSSRPRPVTYEEREETRRRPNGPVAAPAEPALDVRFGDAIRVLGHDGDLMYFLNFSGQVQPIRARDLAKATSLYLLASREWWYEHYGEKEIKVKKGGNGQTTEETRRLPLDAIAGGLMAACKEAGVFRPSRVRGRGVWWLDGLGPVIHLGDRIVAGGGTYDPRNFKGGGSVIFEARPRLDIRWDEKLPPDKARAVLDACELLNFPQPGQGRLLAGWIVTALVGGALEWRAHLWLTGPSKAGKSWCVTRIIQPLLGPVRVHTQSSNSTPAGIRQEMGADCLPVVFDEADASSKRDRERIQGVLELARAAASGADLPILQGTTNHAGIRFNVRSSFLIASIFTPLIRQADASRFVPLELRAPKTEETKKHIKLAVAPFVEPHFQPRLFRRATEGVKRLREDAELLAQAIDAVLHDRRLGDVYGHLLAGSLLLESDKPLKDLHAAKTFVAEHAKWLVSAAPDEPDEGANLLSLVGGLAIEVEPPEGSQRRPLRMSVYDAVVKLAAFKVAREDEHAAVMQWRTNAGLMPRKVWTYGGKTHKDRVATGFGSNLAAIADALSRLGIRVDGDRGRAIVLFANVSPTLCHALDDTPFADDRSRRNILARLDGAGPFHVPRRFAIGFARCTAVTIEAFLARDEPEALQDTSADLGEGCNRHWDEQP